MYYFPIYSCAFSNQKLNWSVLRKTIKLWWNLSRAPSQKAQNQWWKHLTSEFIKRLMWNFQPNQEQDVGQETQEECIHQKRTLISLLAASLFQVLRFSWLVKQTLMYLHSPDSYALKSSLTKTKGRGKPRVLLQEASEVAAALLAHEKFLN